MTRVSLLFLSLLIGIWLAGCKQKTEPLFETLPSSKTGITFNNAVVANEYFNILTFEYVYNGGGAGIGDFNNDSLPDIFFSGNVVSNRLYLNKGDLRFRDITEEAGVAAEEKWCTGVSVVDINGDGWQDIYVCASVYNEGKRGNLLFINQGLNEEGEPVFEEQAEAYGIADQGYSIQGAFFDYDNDNDLDLYVLTNQVETISPNKYRYKMNNGSSPSNDRIYKNNGNGTFTNATREADIFYEGYGLGISIRDINEDGWKDIYITNDYMTNDVLLVNNGDGSFTNRIRNFIKHQNHSAMGHDVADINNDGLPDIFALDMVPEDVQHMKSTMLPTKYNDYVMNEKYGYEHQYIRNVLHLNNGPDHRGNHTFSEISLYAGVFATYWSWAPLFADLDNDGMKDLFISNGFPKDVTDMDFGAVRYQQNMSFNKKELLETIPESRIPNYLYKNLDGLTFEKKTEAWGLGEPSFSNGAVFADLDRDGDLDLITNNINDEAFVYRNRLMENRNDNTPHYLRIQLSGPEENPAAFGTRVRIWQDGKQQFQEFSPFRGYTSSVEPVIHFGLGNRDHVDSIELVWPDNTKKVLGRTHGDQTLLIRYEAGDPAYIYQRPDPAPYFTRAGDSLGTAFKHEDIVFVDFNIQLTIPHQFSQYGPSISVGDINGDEALDFFLGGSLGIGGTFFIRENDRFAARYFDDDHKKNQEDLGTLLFDADQDGDLDLYIVSGSYEQPLSEKSYRDRIYENDGKGNFSRLDDALPDFLVSGSCVKAADYDQDGDLDLFVGGRLAPGKYPMPVNSYLLENISEQGRIAFRDATADQCPDLVEFGLVMDALWTDFNNDHKTDLIVVGEWMPVTFFENRDTAFVNITESTGISDHTGWWKSITGADFDNDGDIDYVVGNLGENAMYKASPDEPMVAYADDYDNNGMSDIIIGRYFADQQGKKDLYPVHSADDLLKQVPVFGDRFPTYASYGRTPLEEVFTEAELAGSYRLEATWLSTSYIENLGNGRFSLKRLPDRVQFAPVYGMVAHDIDEDGLTDLIMTGNDYGNNPYWGRYDALNGLVLLNKGAGNWDVLTYPESGFFVPGDGKALASLPLNSHSSLYLASQNQDSLRTFTREHRREAVIPDPGAASAMVYTRDYQKKTEFYYGHAFLSQGAKTLYIPEETDSVIFYDFSGNRINK